MNNASTCAVWYKLWLETRMRFLIALGLVMTATLLFVVMRRHYFPLAVKIHPDATYAQYIYWRVFTSAPRALYQMVGLVIGLSGWQRERSVGSLGFSLSLPRGRTQQVVDRALFEAAQMAAIPGISLLLVWALSNALGHELPLTMVLAFLVLWTTGALFVYALTFLCSVILTNEYAAIAAAYVLYIGDLLVTHMPRWRPYPLNGDDLMEGYLGNVIDHRTGAWTGHVPVALLGGHLGAAALLVAIAVLIVSRQEV